MGATVFNLTSASSTVHYFRREGHERGPNQPANDDGEDSEPIGDFQGGHRSAASPDRWIATADDAKQRLWG